MAGWYPRFGVAGWAVDEDPSAPPLYTAFVHLREDQEEVIGVVPTGYMTGGRESPGLEL